MPRSRQVRMIRTAISPRLAMRTRRNTSTTPPSGRLRSVQASGAASPAGLSLLKEGGHALTAFFAGASGGDQCRGVLIDRRTTVARHSPDELLACCQPIRPACKQLVNNSPNGYIDLSSRHDLMHEADRERALGVEALAGEE